MSVIKSDYAYHLPETSIAQQPADPRDSSRMLVLDRRQAALSHHVFSDLPDFLVPGSVMVVNNSKVIPARLPGNRVTGGKMELLLIQEEEVGVWRCKVKNSGRLKEGELLDFCDGALHGELLEKLADGECRLRFATKDNLFELLEKFAYAPLPPYIHKARTAEVKRGTDLKNYQTIFAQEYGAIAAPTAGLHFTPAVMERIRRAGVEIHEITLHVGLGTFEPIRVEDVRDHQMHWEQFTITTETAAAINRAKGEGRPVVAVGTTSIRTLESACENGRLQAGTRQTNLFIYPPYRFQMVDQVLTNFHLPESTLLMLIAAFAGKDFIMEAYRKAVAEHYRFYSYGDCMLIQ